MKLDGTHTLAATPSQLFAGIHDPDVLKACLPKCERVERVSDNTLQAHIVVSAKALSATLKPEISFIAENAPHDMTVRVSGSVLLARFEADVEIRLVSKAGATELTYSTEAGVPKLIALRFGDQIDKKLEKLAEKIFVKLAAASAAKYPASG